MKKEDAKYDIISEKEEGTHTHTLTRTHTQTHTMRECTAVPENDAVKGVRHGRRAGLSRVAGEAYVAKTDLVAPASTAFEGADTAPHADDAVCGGGGGGGGGTAGCTTATMRIEQLEEAASVADSTASSACDPYASDLRLCKGGCGFYGTKSRLWYCSKCRTHEEEQAAESLEPTPAFKASHGRRSLC